MRTFVLLIAAFAFAACADSTPMDQTSAPNQAPDVRASEFNSLGDILASQPDEVKARYAHRHPAETLASFGVEPGMTVVEALPGGGWYSKILLPFLGDDGALIGASYTIDMRRLFGFYSEERLKELETWDTDWPANAATWIDGNNTPISAFFFGSMPQATQATADAVLFIRALHNLARFEDQGGYLPVRWLTPMRS